MAAGHALVMWCRGGVREQSAVTLLLRLSRCMDGLLVRSPVVQLFSPVVTRAACSNFWQTCEPKISQLSRALFWPLEINRHPAPAPASNAPPQWPVLMAFPMASSASPSATANGTLEV